MRDRFINAAICEVVGMAFYVLAQWFEARGETPMWIICLLFSIKWALWAIASIVTGDRET